LNLGSDGTVENEARCTGAKPKVWTRLKTEIVAASISSCSEEERVETTKTKHTLKPPKYDG